DGGTRWWIRSAEHRAILPPYVRDLLGKVGSRSACGPLPGARLRCGGWQSGGNALLTAQSSRVEIPVVCDSDTRSARTSPRSLPGPAGGRGGRGRVGTLPARAVQREREGVALLDRGAGPAVPNDPGHGGTPGRGVHIPPACRVRLHANGGELGEPGGRRGTP